MPTEWVESKTDTEVIYGPRGVNTKSSLSYGVRISIMKGDPTDLRRQLESLVAVVLKTNPDMRVERNFGSHPILKPDRFYVYFTNKPPAPAVPEEGSLLVMRLTADRLLVVMGVGPAAEKTRNADTFFRINTSLTNLNDPETAFRLARERYVRQDYAGAWELSEKAVAAGHLGGKALQGAMRLSGQGTRRDINEGVRLLTEAAEGGDLMGQSRLGALYSNAWVFFSPAPPDSEERAFKWLSLAAPRGDLLAQHYLGMAYIDGKGVAQNRAEGIRWLQTAAEGGNTESAAVLRRLRR
jgi:hypothetical protein